MCVRLHIVDKWFIEGLHSVEYVNCKYFLLNVSREASTKYLKMHIWMWMQMHLHGVLQLAFVSYTRPH